MSACTVYRLVDLIFWQAVFITLFIAGQCITLITAFENLFSGFNEPVLVYTVICAIDAFPIDHQTLHLHIGSRACQIKYRR